MPLILAVEPDKKQAAKIASLGRGTLKAEVVVAESAHRALQLLDGRVPDLILTSLLLSPRDEAVLTDRLRELNAAASHVQTLVIPVLATARRTPKRSGGLLKRLTGSKRKDGSPDGCELDVFASQIQEYLERAAVELERAQGAAERVVSAQHVHLYGDAWPHVEEQSATEATNDITAADLPEGIDPAFAQPVDETSWPEPRTDFLRSLDDEMRAADHTWAESAVGEPGTGELAAEAATTDGGAGEGAALFTPPPPSLEPPPEFDGVDLARDAVNEPLSVIRPAPVTPVSEPPPAEERQWAEFESSARTSWADKADTVGDRNEAAETVAQPYEAIFTPVREVRAEPVADFDRFNVVRRPSSEPISVIRPETDAPSVEPLSVIRAVASEPLSVIRADVPEPLSAIRPEASEPLSVIWPEAFTASTTDAKDAEPVEDRFWQRDEPYVLESPQVNAEPLPEVAAFSDAMATTESWGDPASSTYEPHAARVDTFEHDHVETFEHDHVETFEPDVFAEPDRSSPPTLFTRGGASHGDPRLDVIGFDTVSELVPPVPAQDESVPGRIDDQWAEVLLGPGLREAQRKDDTENIASAATPGVLNDQIFDLDTTSPPTLADLDAFVRELTQSRSRFEREPILPPVAESQAPRFEPPLTLSVPDPVPTLSIAPAHDVLQELRGAPESDSQAAISLTPPSDPVLTIPRPPEPVQAQQAAAPSSPVLPQLEVLEMLTAIRRDLEQIKGERPPNAPQPETQAAQAPVAIAPPSEPVDSAHTVESAHPVESQPRPQPPRAPRLTKSTARRKKRPEPPRRKKSKTAAPIQDEWGFFDPDQCGFAALLDKLEEIESEKPPTDED
jgi:CheY-like chemotaxis protein